MKSKYLVEIGLAALVLIGFVIYYQNTKINSQNVTVSPPVKQSTLISTESARVKNTISYDCEKGKTAYIILKEQYQTHEKVSDLGPMVTSIDGNKPQANQYWAFYIDGKLAPVGANTYVCQDQEKVEWKLENF